jgi:hypothetical protein
MTVSSQWNKLSRDRLFYSRFKFRAKFTLRGVSRTRYANDWAHYYERHQDYLDEQKKYQQTEPPAWYSASWYTKLPDAYELQDIERFINWRNKNRDQVTIRLEYDSCSIFSNDECKLEELSKVLLLKVPVYTEIVNTTDDETITIHNPRHQYRTYLREVRLSTEDIAELNNFFDTYTANRSVMPSQALYRWLNLDNISRGFWRGQRTRTDFYFEHDDPGMPFMFAIVFSNLLRKTYTLKPR